MQRGEISVTKRKDIHFRIEEKLLERFESALHYEGLKKTDVLTHASSRNTSNWSYGHAVGTCG